MKYKIIHKPKYTNASKVGIETHPDNEPLKFFLSGLKVDNLSLLLKNVVKSKGYGEEIAGGVIFYNDLTPEDFINGWGFETGNVKIFHPVFGETVIDEMLFRKIIYDFIQAVVALKNEENGLNAELITEINYLLKLLNQNIERV